VKGGKGSKKKQKGGSQKGKGTNYVPETTLVNKKHVHKKQRGRTPDIVTKVKTCTFKAPQNSTTIQWQIPLHNVPSRYTKKKMWPWFYQGIIRCCTSTIIRCCTSTYRVHTRNTKKVRSNLNILNTFTKETSSLKGPTNIWWCSTCDPRSLFVPP